ncbi:similar to Saccharomyces cerevisiae YDR402C DIT2 N-formyltyrosine oxidase [Maudiozyma saulgeensis]|uniref:Similar to Saccharomyces cerevisiae YDR402C DIT2 N-formyltyrosine oxidase n=1 Tax=Maudiozyma saulgeensis TaxID=1789683 RepID=A0A1X7R2C5_9SACH|nr:similar to Saccharomyces cerevisiae YDR402C DIT2 N-formyltyrosine oxidase [Kazachstania saulgeensis]
MEISAMELQFLVIEFSFSFSLPFQPITFYHQHSFPSKPHIQSYTKKEKMISLINFVSLVFLMLIGIIIFKIVLPPLNFPRNIPTIPFYVIFLPSITKMDQLQLYELYLKEPLEKYGAVKLFFGARWNILIGRPEYLSEIFKKEDIFAKSGNQKKIPYSAIAAYTGDNIISAHGEVWKKYRSIMTTGLQQFDDSSFEENAKLFVKLIRTKLSDTDEKVLEQNGVPVIPLIQRLALDNISQTLLGFNFGTLSNDSVPLHEHLIRIKRQIFQPLFLTFPFLDLLKLPQRKKAFSDIEEFRNILVDRVQTQLIENYKFEQTKYVSSDLIRAYTNKTIDYKQLTDNIVIMLVAGHENPQLLLTSLLYFLAKHKDTWQNLIWNEVKDVTDMKFLPNLPQLNSFILETARIYPPLNIIINRCTSKKCRLGNDIIIPKNTYVGYHNYNASHDKTHWGNTADDFEPRRWGDDIESIMKNWRHHKNNSSLSSFHGGKRACLGEKLALSEMRITICELLKQFEITVAPGWEDRVTPAGPLCPAGLHLNFTEREVKI